MNKLIEKSIFFLSGVFLLVVPMIILSPVFGAIIIGHENTEVHQIPDTWIDTVKSELHIAYQHTSHGSQLITGMNALENFTAFGSKYEWSDSGSSGQLDLDDNGIPGCADLSQGDSEDENGDTPWTIATRTLLDNSANNHINVIMWSWCNIGGHDIPRYLTNMEKLISEYGEGGTSPRAAAHPVKFVFMTGHANGGGEGDSSDSRNVVIRQHCIDNNRILFDFSDIENYDPDGNYFLDKNLNDALYYDNDGNGSRESNWATEYLARHPGSELYQLVKGVEGYSGCSSCAHSGGAGDDSTLNCVLKGRAVWWMFARLVGWSGNELIPAPSGLTAVADSVNQRISLTWTDNSTTYNEDNFILQRQFNGGAWVDVDTAIPADTVTYLDESLAIGTYAYRVIAHLDNDGTGSEYNSVPSNVASAEIISADPPVAPSDVNAVADSQNGTIGLTWTDNSNNESGFIIHRQVDGGVWDTDYDNESPNQTSFTDTGLLQGMYTYRVQAYNDFGSALSGTSSATIIDLPASPSGLVVNGNLLNGTVGLVWTDNSDNETGFIIQRQVNSGAWNDAYDNVGADVTSVTDNNHGGGPLPTGEYNYRVVAYNNDGNSSPSNEESVMISSSVPSAPTGLVSDLDGMNIILDWDDNSDNEEFYIVERRIGSGVYTEIADNLPPDTVAYVDIDLPPYFTYTYRVRARNSFGYSLYSNEVSRYLSPETTSVNLQSPAEVDDAFLSSSSATSNYGSTPYVNPFDRFVIKFHLPPELSNKRVVDASIGFYGWGQSSSPAYGEYLELYRLTADWAEDEVTWNNSLTAQAWTTAGGDYDPVMVGQTEIAGGSDHDFFPEMDVTELVQAWIDGDVGNYGVILLSNSSEPTGLKASEYNENKRTYLNVRYDFWQGDINLDGSVNDQDVTACVNHILGKELLVGQQLQNADINHDGEVNVLDVVGIVNSVR